MTQYSGHREPAKVRMAEDYRGVLAQAAAQAHFVSFEHDTT